MLPTLYKVTNIESGTLSVMAKPVAGEWLRDEISGLRQFGVDRLVSLLELAEERELGLGDEGALCAEFGIHFSSFPIADRGLPDTQQARALAAGLLAEIRQGEHAAIHCRAGIGRTGIIAGAVLIAAEYSAADALALISAARGVAVPDTDQQLAWLHAL